MKEAHSPADFLSGKCYVIQIYTQRQIHHEGDERSKRYPGHGYPAWTETVNQVQQFATYERSEWERKLKELYQQDLKRKNIIAFIADRACIEPRIELMVVE